MEVVLDPQSHIPLYRQIVEQIQSQILGCKLTPGVRLPPVRELAGTLNVSVPTALRAYSELQERGLIGASIGSGTYVADPSTRWAGVELLKSIRVQGPLNIYEPLSSQTGIRSLATAITDPKLFHTDEFLAEIRDAVSSNAWSFYFAPPMGVGELLREGANLLAQRGIEPAEGELLVGPGSRATMALALQALGQAGDGVLMEDPSSLGTPTTVPTLGFRPIFVSIDASGTLDLDLAERAILTERPRFLILRPAYGHCVGACWTPEKANRLVALLERTGTMLLEIDDTCRLALDEAPPPAISPRLARAGLGIYIESLDYSLSPALRTSFVWAPATVLNRILYFIRSIDPTNPTYLQSATARFLAKGGLRSHLKRLLPRLSFQRNAAMAALERHMPSEVRWRRPQGGLSVWLELPEGPNYGQLYEEALEAGVGFAPGWMLRSGPHAAQGIRLSYGLANPEAFAEASAILGRLIRSKIGSG